jgi:hypothetical protein
MQSTPRPWQRLSSLVALAAILGLGSLTACNSNAVDSKALPTATAGGIRIAVGHTHYGINDPVGVTVTNTSSNQTYYAVSGRSGCTYLQLQQYDAVKKSWVSVFGCPGANPTPLEITPQLSEPFTLAPNSSTNPDAWDPGTYRVALLYSTNSDGTSSPLLAYSSAYTIVSG